MSNEAPKMLRMAIDHAFGILSEHEDMIPFLLVDGDLEERLALLGGATANDCAHAAVEFIEQKKGQIDEYAFTCTTTIEVEGRVVQVIMVVHGRRGNVEDERYMQPYLPLSHAKGPKLAGDPVQIDNCKSYLVISTQ